jgi:hypothetical protein
VQLRTCRAPGQAAFLHNRRADPPAAVVKRGGERRVDRLAARTGGPAFSWARCRPALRRQRDAISSPARGYRFSVRRPPRQARRAVRERRLTQRRRRLDRRRRPGFFQATRPDELWHLDTTSVWLAEHGWCYLMAAIDCCTREIVGWHLELRCRATGSIGLVERAAAARAIALGTLTLGTDTYFRQFSTPGRYRVPSAAITAARPSLALDARPLECKNWLAYAGAYQLTLLDDRARTGHLASLQLPRAPQRRDRVEGLVTFTGRGVRISRGAFVYRDDGFPRTARVRANAIGSGTTQLTSLGPGWAGPQRASSSPKRRWRVGAACRASVVAVHPQREVPRRPRPALLHCGLQARGSVGEGRDRPAIGVRPDHGR